MKTNGNTTVSWIAEVDHEATHDSEKSNLNWAQGKLNSTLSIISKMQKSILIKHAFTLLRQRRPRAIDKGKHIDNTYSASNSDSHGLIVTAVARPLNSKETKLTEMVPFVMQKYITVKS